MIQKLKAKGIKGKTVFYTINAALDGDVLTWAAFRLYSPTGDKTETGTITEMGKAKAVEYGYFDIPAGSEPLEREEIGKTIYVVAGPGYMSSDPYDVIEVYDGEKKHIQPGDGGDIVIAGRIPAETETGEINLIYKEIKE
ncbi:MAG: hypothetical protein GY765_02870 [bacterium]|nr:hypothetical protein [bacterium]